MRDDLILSMRHSPIHNYIVPGLTSWLIGNPGPKGVVRLLECTRQQQESIAPHSHRFDFQCHVLRGTVVNRVWYEPLDGTGDQYMRRSQKYLGRPGHYETRDDGVERWVYQDRTFNEGETYQMHADEVHSIVFARGTLVLFLEGPPLTDTSFYLQPWVYGDQAIPTGDVQPWMFRSPE